MKTTLQIAVRALVEHVLRSGDLDSGFLGSGRAVEGTRAHQAVQGTRPEGYSPEVPVSYRIESEQFTLTVSGRIDGVYEHTDPVIIEEIKTTTRSIDDLANRDNPLHWGQLKCYAFIFASERNIDQIEAHLTYVQLDSGDIHTFQRNFSRSELDVFFRDLTTKYLRWAQTLADWTVLRDGSARALEFPYPEYRPGQRQLAVAVYRTMRDHDHLLARAATGIGKTMATIFPAVKALAQGIHRKFFYLTARTTGRMAALQAMKTLCNNGLRLKALVLTAKDKICFLPDSQCTPEECEFARGFYDRLGKAIEAAFEADLLTREIIEQVARDHNICPFEFSLELANWSDCIICDYNYAFDPRVFLKRFFLDGPCEFTFLIDEAHNLVDRSREMFSAQLCKQAFLDVRRAVRHEQPAIFKALGRINAWFVRARKTCEEAGSAIAEVTPPHSLFPLLRQFMKLADEWLARNLPAAYRQALTELYLEVAGFMRIADQYDETYATCRQVDGTDLHLKLFCIDPSGRMRDALKRCQAAIFFSATLSPPWYFKTLFGCSDSAAHIGLPSPFSPDKLALFIDSRISTLFKHRQRTALAVARALASLVEQKQGNYLLFFPSYEYMQNICEHFRTECPSIEIAIQSPEMTETEREAFLALFSAENCDTLVGFAVMGGIFGEGIDLVGDRLSGAAVIGVGLPGICLERELIRTYFESAFGSGFEFAYQYPGINRVLQAAGRVIRTDEDRGVVLLIDQRFSAQRYRSLLPGEWRPRIVRSPAGFQTALSDFWAETAEGSDKPVTDFYTENAG